jgi:glycine cleavage system aminomethyltransferase T
MDLQLVGKCEMAGQEFQLLKDIVQPDSRGRLSIGAVAKGKSYRVMVNNDGQILLDPVVAIPERELWLWQNPEAIASVQRGIQQAADGELNDMGDFSQYAEADKFNSLTGPKGEDVFEAYVENRTPAAYRVFWCYGPEQEEITILAITPHP